MALTVGRTAIGWSILQRDQVPTFEVQLRGGVAKLHIRAGDTATILCDLIKRYDAAVEPVIGPVLDYWTWALRMVRESTKTWSEHSSGTALDIRALLHPRGKRGTSTPEQVEAIRELLDFYEGVVDWGGDFKTTVDEMHFEIGAKPGDPAIARVAAKIRTLEDQLSDKAVAEIKAALAAQVDTVAEAVFYRLTHKAFTGDESGEQLDRRPPVQIALVGARASLALLTLVQNLSKQVTALAAASGDDATKAQVTALGVELDGKLEELLTAVQQDPVTPPAPSATH